MEPKKHSNAVIFCIMDASGSMDSTKKYLARSFYFLLYQFVKLKYKNTELVFIAHHTEAKEVNEDDFFHKVESGGTYISSGYIRALDIIEERYNPEVWNIYSVHCSDGDNWPEDKKTAVQYLEKLVDVSNLAGYIEIKPDTSWSWSSMLDWYKPLIENNNNFICLTMRKKEDIWENFKKLLTIDRSESE